MGYGGGEYPQIFSLRQSVISLDKLRNILLRVCTPFLISVQYVKMDNNICIENSIAVLATGKVFYYI